MPVYSEVDPTVFNAAYTQESVYMRAAVDIFKGVP